MSRRSPGSGYEHSGPKQPPDQIERHVGAELRDVGRYVWLAIKEEVKGRAVFSCYVERTSAKLQHNPFWPFATEQPKLRPFHHHGICSEVTHSLGLNQRRERCGSIVFGQATQQCLRNGLGIAVCKQPDNLAHGCIDVVSHTTRAVFVMPNRQRSP
jgi:hypothetical protein